MSEDDATTQYDVPLTPLPCWQHMTPAQHQEACREIAAQVELEAAERNAALGRVPMGVAAILAQAPHDAPAQTSRSPAPLVHATTPAIRRAYRAAYDAFVTAYRAAARGLRERARELAFPVGAFVPPGPFLAGVI